MNAMMAHCALFFFMKLSLLNELFISFELPKFVCTRLQFKCDHMSCTQNKNRQNCQKGDRFLCFCAVTIHFASLKSRNCLANYKMWRVRFSRIVLRTKKYVSGFKTAKWIDIVQKRARGINSYQNLWGIARMSQYAFKIRSRTNRKTMYNDASPRSGSKH